MPATNPATTAGQQQDSRIPGLAPLPTTTARTALLVPAYDPATDTTYKATIDAGDGVVTANAVVGGHKQVLYRSSLLYGVPAGVPTLDRLAADTLVPGTLATVENPSDTPLSATKPPRQYVATHVAAGTAGAVQVPAYIGAAAGTTVPIVWVAVVGGGGGGTVSSVNGVGPDGAGNVQLPTSGAGTQYVNLKSEQGKRVAFLTLPQALTVQAALLVDNASAVHFQVNQKISGNWQPGVQESAAAITTRLAGLSAADYQAGVELEIETLAQSVNTPLAALLPLTGSWLSGGLVPLSGTRGGRRVYNPNTSPQPAQGLLFNDATQSGLPAQYLRVPTPSLSLACVTFWLKRGTPWSGYECLLTLRPYANRYVFMQDNPNGAELVVYANGQPQGAAPANGTPYGQWVRVVMNLENVPAGFLTLLAFTDGNAPLHDVEVYDVRYYSRQYTAAELADLEAGPTDSLLARYELAAGTTGSSVMDLSGNGNPGQLFGF